MGLIKKPNETIMGTASIEPGSVIPSAVNAPVKPVFKDTFADGQREGNRRNIASVLTAAIVGIQGLKKEEAWETFKFFHAKMTELDS